MKLKESIETDEYGTLNAVKGLLRRYEKYRVRRFEDMKNTGS